MPKRQGDWLTLMRVALVVVGVVTVSLTRFPPGYDAWAWGVVAFFIAATVFDAALSRRELSRTARVRARALAIVLDGVVGIGFVAVFSYQSGEPYRALYLIPIAEAALRFGLLGGALGGASMVSATIVVDALGRAGVPWQSTLARVLVGVLAGVVIGHLRDSLAAERAKAEARAGEAGHRVDVLEAANRVARALASSLELDEAFGAFIRELGGLIPFERTAIVLVEGDRATTMATAGVGAKTVYPPGSVGSLRGSVLEAALSGELIVRRDFGETEFPEDAEFVALGLHSELVAPLMIGAKPIGMLAVSRKEVDAFSSEEMELLALLGRLVATGVQNIRAYEAERHTVEELRRLSALRADFVSLVSHELRAPMAAVIGAARTLQERWRTLKPDQREAFLALIGDETNRLAILIGDVLDTSRIEAGTFSYRFGEVDLAQLVEDVVSSATIGQDAVRVKAKLPGALPPIHGDGERLRQVLGNLIDNAIKYSPEGDEVEVYARRENGVVLISVVDHGPGIPRDQHRLIFEKFGRADVPGPSKPGSGLGLFIARSIAEAHGGSLDVHSQPEQGATFTLTLPLES